MITDVIVITGPTAVGKSDIAVEVAKKVNGEIISADSMQIFKGLDIGSGKITQEETQGIKHHLLDIKNFDEEYSVAVFCEQCKDLIKQIYLRGKTPIIVGGTGLYVKALVNNYNYFGVERDEKLREELEKEIEEVGLESLYERLKKLSPKIAEKISLNDKKRIIRGLEICAGKLREQKVNKSDFSYKIFVLNTEREVLYNRINKRVDKMLENGLLEEVKGLVNKGMTIDMQSAKGIGYSELIAYLNSEISLDEAVDKIKQH